jgi:hypothetical protein
MATHKLIQNQCNLPSLFAAEVLKPFIERAIEEAWPAVTGKSPWPSVRGFLRLSILRTLAEVVHQERYQLRRAGLPEPSRLSIPQADELVLLPIVRRLVHYSRMLACGRDVALGSAGPLGFLEQLVIHTAINALRELERLREEIRNDVNEEGWNGTLEDVALRGLPRILDQIKTIAGKQT